MPLFLTRRDTNASERMDDPDCDRDELYNTYRQFRVVNSLISQWHAIYKKHIREYARTRQQACRILDIGFGGGDIPLKLAEWCASDGITPRITAIETDERAVKYVQRLDSPQSVDFEHISSTEILKRGNRYDFVISNHLLHHLEEDQLAKLLNEAQTLSNHKVLFNDIERSDIGYVLFNLLSRPIFRSSFITDDGLTSIRRSYTRSELQEAVPDNWRVRRIFPYRLLLIYEHE
ncbi:MAG: methyltransferase domain-containing protein [Balneolaceae bacterium]|nr:methyltransferase domain-containing protein [Balneolaceae bacterium]